MRIECAWCKGYMGTVPGRDVTSHGICMSCMVPMLEPRFDLTDEEQVFVDETRPHAIVQTNIMDESGATELWVLWRDYKTYVSPCGEDQNGDDWVFDAYLTVEAVLSQYLYAQRDE